MPSRYSRFVRAIELHEMARDDKSIHHRPLSSSSHIVLVSLSIVSFLVSSRSSCYCVSFSLIVAPIRAVIVFIIYHPLLLIYPLISPLSLPFLIAPYSQIAALRFPPLRSYPYRPSSSLPDGEIELNKTARPSVPSNDTPISANRHRPIGFHNGATGGEHAATIRNRK